MAHKPKPSPTLDLKLTTESRSEVLALAARWRCSAAAVVRRLIAEAARQELVPSAPKS